MKKETIIENGIKLKKYTDYYDNGNIEGECYRKEGKFHRENGSPAIICYYQNGNIERKYYYKEGKCHRENKPAIIWYYENGNIEKEWYYKDGIEITDELQIMVMKGLSNV